MGTHIKNGILYSSGFDFQPITRATYDALTESEKTKGAYVITDEDIQSTNADQVTYESGTVKDALDGLRTSGTSGTVELTGSSLASFQAPCDGYYMLTGDGTGYRVCSVKTANNYLIGKIAVTQYIGFDGIFLKKGMVVILSADLGDGTRKSLWTPLDI